MKKDQLNVIVYEEEEYQLPKVVRGRTLSATEKQKIANMVCKLYATDQYSLKECLEFCGIKSRTTWFRWLGELEQVEQLYKDAQSQRDVIYKDSLKERARRSLERAIDGYTVIIKETITEPFTDENGNVEMKLRAVREKEQYIKPVYRAIETALANTDSDNFLSLLKKHTEEGNEVAIIDWLQGIEIDDSLPREPIPLFRSEEEAREYGKKIQRP